MHFFTCPKYKFIWFTDQNVYSCFHQLLTFLSSFSFFFCQLEIRVLDLLPLYLPLPPISAENSPSFVPQGTENRRNFHSFGLLGSGSGGHWWEKSQACGMNVSLDFPTQLGHPPTALHVFPQSVSDAVSLCPDTCALLQPFTVFFMLFSMWFHSVTWQRARGRYGKDQFKLISSRQSLTWTHTGIVWTSLPADFSFHLGMFTPNVDVWAFSSVQFSRSVVSDSVAPWTAARQASLSITDSQNLLKLMCIELVMLSKHLILCRPLLHPPSIFPSIRVFSNESALRIRWPKCA